LDKIVKEFVPFSPSITVPSLYKKKKKEEEVLSLPHAMAETPFSTTH
jgi:hypothetical protein